MAGVVQSFTLGIFTNRWVLNEGRCFAANSVAESRAFPFISTRTSRLITPIHQIKPHKNFPSKNINFSPSKISINSNQVDRKGKRKRLTCKAAIKKWLVSRLPHRHKTESREAINLELPLAPKVHRLPIVRNVSYLISLAKHFDWFESRYRKSFIVGNNSWLCLSTLTTVGHLTRVLPW